MPRPATASVAPQQQIRKPSLKYLRGQILAMLRTKRTLHSNRLRRKLLDHCSDILSAAFAGHHEVAEGLRPLEHDQIIGEEKEK